MQTYTSGRNLYGQLTNNASAANLTLGDKLINIADSKVINSKNWDFLEGDRTISTIANQQYYKLPFDCSSVKSVQVQIQSINYQPKDAPSRDYWNYLNESTVTTSDIPEWYYISEGKIGFWPIPTTNYINNITLIYEKKRKDLSLADYITGTITNIPTKVAFTGSLVAGATSGTLTATWTFPTGSYLIVFSSGERRIGAFTNGSTAVTFSAITVAATITITVESANGGSLVLGNGTTWTTKMNGLWIQLTDSATTNTGDGYWYQIDTVLATNQLSLVKEYGGQDVSSGTAAYTIGQTSLLPEDHQDVPIFKAVEIYYTTIQPDTSRAGQHKTLYLEGLKVLMDDFSEKGTSPVVEDEIDFGENNPNLFVRL